MAPRKPPGVKFETFIEAQIRRAQEAGDFENLPGEGKPLEKAGKRYDPDWWAKQLVQRENLSILPPSLEIRREVEKGLASLAELRSEQKVRDRIRELNAKIRKVNSQVTSGPPSTQPPLDEEAEVERWRQAADRS
ncbi:MAG: DUF1992 domain-containing protein [Myxococcota bacterium]|jgi:hypothetical protein